MLESFLDNKKIVYERRGTDYGLHDYIYYYCTNLYTTLKDDDNTIILNPFFLILNSIDYYFTYNKTTGNVESVLFQPHLFKYNNDADARKFKYLA